MRITKILQKKLREEFQEAFRIKNQLLFDHLWGCIELGAPIPQVRIYWSETKQDFVMEIHGPNSRVLPRARNK